MFLEGQSHIFTFTCVNSEGYQWMRRCVSMCMSVVSLPGMWRPHWLMYHIHGDTHARMHPPSSSLIDPLVKVKSDGTGQGENGGAPEACLFSCLLRAFINWLVLALPQGDIWRNSSVALLDRAASQDFISKWTELLRQISQAAAFPSLAHLLLRTFSSISYHLSPGIKFLLKSKFLKNHIHE